MPVKAKDLKRFGWKDNDFVAKVLGSSEEARLTGIPKSKILQRLGRLDAAPGEFLGDEHFGEVAAILQRERESQAEARANAPRLEGEPAPCKIWGEDDLDELTLQQMDRARRLPIAVRAAQMPDGHVGYGLPIGGVLATRNAVIPYGVGVDIGCRMKMSIMPEAATRIDGWRDRLKKVLRAETRFGIGAGFRPCDRREHDVLDDPAWDDLPGTIRHLRDKAWDQLGSSGSGNHFVEWGELVLEESDLGLEPGRYLALLSHSGSRGFGANVAQHYTKIAMDKVHLPKEARHLAWLDLDSQEGREYWLAMNLAGNYASANHDLIHRHVLAAAGVKPVFQVENHHNFAWLEEHEGQQVVVHRKGATPAGEGVLGIIPGSMADPGFIVRGLGNKASLDSAAHGAGRRMSRGAAKRKITKSDQLKYLQERGVELLAAGLDESPQAYKNIHDVMEAQKDLVRPVAAFYPRIVLMASGGKAED